MKSEHAENASLVEAAANRLRVVQLDFADEPAEVRRQYLEEELERAVTAVPHQERAAFLEALLERFPTWDERVEVAAPAVVPQTRSAADERELRDSSFLVSRLIEAARGLSPAERQVVCDRLAAAGLAGHNGAAPWPDEEEDRLRKAIGIDGNAGIDAARTLQAVGLLGHCVTKLERMAWTTWREIAPKSPLRATANLQRDLARFVSGDGDVASEQIEQELGAFRRIVASLVAAIQGAAVEFGRRYVEKYSVPSIEKLVEMGPGGLLKTREFRCWEKYRELANDLNQETIRRDLLAAIASFAGRSMEGTGGSA
jgi:hypothetical protein